MSKKLLRRFFALLTGSFTRRRDEARLRDEIEQHLALQTAENIKAGLTPEEARRQAVLKFGAVEAIKEDYRDVRRLPFLEHLIQDFRYAVRGLRKNPGFTTVAVLTLALGIGATTAVFNILNASVLSPLPVRDPEELIIVSPQFQGKPFILFNPIFETIRQRQHVLTGMFAVNHQPFLRVVFEGETAASYVRASLVSGNYFAVLGLTPGHGRLLSERDDGVEDGSCAAVISESFWRRRLGGNTNVLGRAFQVRDRYCTIVGIAPSDFAGDQRAYFTDVWLPLRPLTDSKLLASRSMAFFSGVMGRLKPGVSAAQAETELTTLYQQAQADQQSQLKKGRFRPADFGVRLISGTRGLERRQLYEVLRLIFGCVVTLLLISGTNIAIMQIARGVSRHRELSTRAALGADRLRLFRQLATEGGVLAALGGILGIALAFVVTPALANVVTPGDVAVGLDVSPDQRVLGIAVVATGLASILGGVVPGLRLSRVRLQAGLTTARTATRSGQGLIRTLVAAQFALALSLLVATGLLLRTVMGLSAVDPGFRPDQVIVLDVRDEQPGSAFGVTDTPEQKNERATRYAVVEERLNALPGVQAASLSWLGLFSMQDRWLPLIDRDAPSDRREARVDYVSARYFETVGMQIVRGRGFTTQDREGFPRVAVVNQALAHQRFGDPDALGRALTLDYPGELDRPYEVVGIVRDSKYNSLREATAQPMLWIPLAQAPSRISSVSLRVRPGMESTVARDARQTMSSVDSHLMVRQVTTLSAQLSERMARERLLFNASWSFGGLSLLLAAIGLFGTLAYGVGQRIREMGVRLALGAESRTLLRMVIGEALRLALAGLVVGIPLAVAIGHILRGFLFGVAPQDFLTLSGASLVLIGTVLLAAYIPARRAASVDPLVALRYE